MRELLRSCFLADAKDSQELFTQNYHILQESSLGFPIVEDSVIWKYIQDFFRGHGHLPTIQTVRGHFESAQEPEVVQRLERLAMINPRTRGDFVSHLETIATDRRNAGVMDLARTMAQIVKEGVDIKDERGKSTRLMGAIDAIRYVLDKSHDLVAPTFGGKLSGNVMQDGHDFLERYDRIKADPTFGTGHFCGVEQIDVVLRGAKRYELWIHAGFTGSLKSTFALHWAYLQAVYFGFSSVYFSLEMPYDQCRNMLYTMHSAHEDFTHIRAQLGIEFGLEYDKVRDAKLTVNEEKFLREYVVPSLNGTRVVNPWVFSNGMQARDPRDYGAIHIEIADPDKTDYTVIDLRARAELIFSKTPFHLIFVDHAGLLASRQRYSSTTDKLNEVIRDLKKLAMSFNRGMGIAVVALAQISREGYKAAEKSGGRYNLTHLSYANEFERSADTVTVTWLDDHLRRQNLAIFQNLKSRDNQPFERTAVKIKFSCRRFITDYTDMATLDEQMKQARAGEATPEGGKPYNKNRKLEVQDVHIEI